MKNVIFLTIFLSFYLFSSAQSYIPFPNSNAIWVNKHFYTDPQGKGGSFCYDSHIITDGDTIITGINYTKLKETKVDWGWVPFTCDNQIDTITHSIYGFLRNDSVNKKVYFRKWGYNYEEVLYDFNLQIGDTLPYVLTSAYYDLIVDSIQIKNIGGVNRRVYTFWQYNPSHKISGELVEGVGNSSGLFGKLFRGNDNILKCLSIYGNGIYPINPNSCAIITSLKNKNIEKTVFEVYPNPVDKTFNIEIPKDQKVKNIQLHDSTGKLVKEYISLNANYSVVDLSSGIYFVRIETEEGVESLKIVVQ